MLDPSGWVTSTAHWSAWLRCLGKQWHQFLSRWYDFEVFYSGTPKSWIRRWRTSRRLWWSTSLKTWRRNTRILWVMWRPGHPSLGRDANLGEKSSLTSFLVVEASFEYEFDWNLCIEINHKFFIIFFWFLVCEKRFYVCFCPVSENDVILLVFVQVSFPKNKVTIVNFSESLNCPN